MKLNLGGVIEMFNCNSKVIAQLLLLCFLFHLLLLLEQLLFLLLLLPQACAIALAKLDWVEQGVIISSCSDCEFL